MPFIKFLDIMLGEQSEYPHYASLQNSSLTTEYKALVNDVDSDIPWFSEAIGKDLALENLTAQHLALLINP